MKVLVTGADGFAGSWLVPHLQHHGHEVVGAIRPDDDSSESTDRYDLPSDVNLVELELSDPASVANVVSEAYDAVVHLAAVSSVPAAARDPHRAWRVNVVGSVTLAERLSARRDEGDDPLLLYVSSAEVYGPGTSSPRREDDATEPVSSYAASKLAGEIGVLEIHRRTGLRVIVARAFGHTGPNQSTRFVVPAFAERIRLAKRVGAAAVGVGNLEPVREFLHVADVVRAYELLLARGESGQIYNVASGEGVALRDVFNRLTEVAHYRLVAETDSVLVRPVDLPHLVGDAEKLHNATGWRATIPLEQTLTEVMHAETD